jgi:hypothetical protein
MTKINNMKFTEADLLELGYWKDSEKDGTCYDEEEKVYYTCNYPELSYENFPMSKPTSLWYPFNVAELADDEPYPGPFYRIYFCPSTNHVLFRWPLSDGKTLFSLRVHTREEFEFLIKIATRKQSS